MNDEIKEILEDLKDSSEGKYINPFELTDDSCKSLLDYITNLQQENQELNDSITWWNNRFNAVQRDYEDYKSRIEKAVEYIENTPLYETTYDYNMEEELEIQNVSDETASNKLLNILNGRSDE